MGCGQMMPNLLPFYPVGFQKGTEFRDDGWLEHKKLELRV